MNNIMMPHVLFGCLSNFGSKYIMSLFISTNKTEYRKDCQEKSDGGPLRNITITSTLIVYGATSKETGFYSCANREWGKSTIANQTQYIYVKGKYIHQIVKCCYLK